MNPNFGPPGHVYQRPPMGYPPAGRMPGQPPAHFVPPGMQRPSTDINLFVGKIKRGVGDDLIRRLLLVCGNLKGWRRVTDPISNQPKAFGYAQYGSAGEALTALRILNGLDIQGQELLLNVDAKTRKALDEFEAANSEGHAAQMEADAGLMQQVRQMVTAYGGPPVPGRQEMLADPTMQNVPSVQGNKEKVVLVKSEIEKFREREKHHEEKKAEREKLKQREVLRRMEAEVPRDPQREKLEKIRRDLHQLRTTRERERENERRKREREEREYHNRERNWEDRKRAKERDMEAKQRSEREVQEDRRRAIAREYEDEDVWRRHVRDPRRRRYRAEELEEDRADRKREAEEREAAGEAPLEEVPASSVGAPLKLDLGASSGLVGVKRTAAEVAADFNEDDEEERKKLEPEQKKRKLVKLDFAAAGLQSEAEKRHLARRAQEIVRRIPAERKDLFAYDINWSVVETRNIIQDAVKPWVTAQVKELLGEEVTDVIDFVVSKVKARTPPAELEKQLEPLLDKEAELFTKMLWRKIIFHVLS